jgi:hypothetical protein
MLKLLLLMGQKTFLDVPRFVQYMHYPNTPIKERIEKLTDSVKKEYAVFVLDDDLLW